MIRKLIARLRRMDAAEATWRGTSMARAILDRARARVVPPRWRRQDLRRALARNAGVDIARTALAAGRWNDAHRALADHVAAAGPRFVISASDKAAMRERILAQFPGAAHEAAARADRILEGQYDVLGYRGLSFGQRAVASGADAVQPDAANAPDRPEPSNRRDAVGPPDWHADPVHGRRAPLAFWSTIPYLDQVCGDHKIIWELNRHQHWIVLGRAYWLTGERKYRDRFLAELESWLEANPPLTGINWASMLELAFRSLSWTWAMQLFVEGPDDTSPWLVDLMLALDRQLTHVEQNLSYYFSPNTHLLGEALALYVAGRAIPELAASERRAAIGRTILVAEIDRQIVADGGHAERSTHYHRYVLDFYMMALVVARRTHDDEAARRFEHAVVRLGAAARMLADDRGRIPHIGDDDGGVLVPLTGRATGDLRDSLAIAAALVDRPDFQVADTPEEVLWVVGPQSAIRNAQSDLRHPQSAVRNVLSSALPDTGYYISRSPAGDHLIIDGGPHGYQNGGHAHADALSLTLTVGGLPLLIDPGTGCYTSEPALRDRMRSTAMHNTLVVDDRSQSAPDGPFHWSHVARTRVHSWRTNDAFDYFDASHDGYGPIEHRRRVFALHNDLVVVADLLWLSPSAARTEVGPAAGPAREASRKPVHHAAVHWHLDPNWTVDARSRGATLSRPGKNGADVKIGLSVPQGIVEPFTADADSGLGWHAPEYGRLERTTTIRVTQSGAAPFWMATVFDLDPENPVADVDWVPVWAEAGATAHAAAMRITRATSVDHVLFAEPALQPPLAASSATKRGLWRIGEIETNARMLFCRTTAADRLDRIAVVDGSVVRTTGRAQMHLRLPLVAPSLFWAADDARTKDYRTEDHRTKDYGTKDQEPRPKDQYSCAALPVS